MGRRSWKGAYREVLYGGLGHDDFQTPPVCKEMLASVTGRAVQSRDTYK